MGSGRRRGREGGLGGAPVVEGTAQARDELGDAAEARSAVVEDVSEGDGRHGAIEPPI